MIEYFNIMTQDVYKRNLSFLWSGLILLVIGASIFLLYIIVKKNARHSKIIVRFMILFIAIAFFTEAANYHSFFSSLIRFRKAFVNEEYKVAEGTVENFVSVKMGNKNIYTDTFELNGKKFSYSDGNKNAAYNRTRMYGSRIKEGLKIRIYYIDDFIINIWIID